jgi:2-oxoglutarate ferredoxin oxidoreductase subunit delta
MNGRRKWCIEPGEGDMFGPSSTPPPVERDPIDDPPRAIRADVRVLTEQCKGCEFCIEFCPTAVLALSESYNAKGYQYPVVVRDNCVDCKLCLTICPEYAIFPVPRVAVPLGGPQEAIA